MTSLSRRHVVGGGLAGGLGLALLPRAAKAAAFPERLVVAGGALTEIAVALGGAKSLVGVDSTSLYPHRVVDAVPKIGYLRTLSTEGILSLNPSLLLASDQAGPPAVFDQLRAVKLPLALIAESFDVDDVPDKVAKVADALGQNAAGREMAAAIAQDLASLRAMVADAGGTPGVLFILSNASDRLMAAGQATAAETMIALAGGRNAIRGYTNYKPLSPEAAVAADPDVIVIPDHVLTALGGVEAARKLPQIANTRAGAASRIVAMDTLFLLGLGPRVAHAGHALAAALHPDAKLPPLPARAWTVS
jgi:iron complex transport system substrate-binding protein